MADSLTRIIEMTQNVEQILEQKYGASGRGLHEKLTSAESKIAPDIQKKIRFIAAIRNKAVHENIAIAGDQFSAVQKAYQQILPVLKKGQSKKKKIGWVLLVLITAAVLGLVQMILQKLIITLVLFLIGAGFLWIIRRRNRCRHQWRK